MIFFLSTQSLLDVLSGNKNVHQWLSGVPMQQVEISAISIGQALETIQRKIASAASRKNFESQLDRLVNAVRSNQGVIAFDRAAAPIWADLQIMTLQYKNADGSMTDLSSASRMVVATALLRGATFVESQQPYHAVISSLTVVSP